jgi:hypothetical protein
MPIALKNVAFVKSGPANHVGKQHNQPVIRMGYGESWARPAGVTVRTPNIVKHIVPNKANGWVAEPVASANVSACPFIPV